MPSLHIDLTGWTLTTASGISGDGRTLVGTGTHNGRSEAWVAYLPSLVTGVSEGSSNPEAGYGRAWPNPFIHETTLRLSLAAESDVRVRVYDASGRMIRTIQNGRVGRGAHDITWDGLDAAGRSMSAGVRVTELVNRACGVEGVGRAVHHHAEQDQSQRRRDHDSSTRRGGSPEVVVLQ